MRDALTTRKLLAKIDREIDVYVVLDRFRQAIYDQDDDIARLERDIKILQDADRERVTKTGVFRIIKERMDERALASGKKFFWMLAAGIGSMVVAFLTWVASLAWRGAHVG